MGQTMVSRFMSGVGGTFLHDVGSEISNLAQNSGSFQGVVGPAGMPRETATKLNAELLTVLNSAEMKERFAKQGTEVRAGTPESLGQWLRTEQARWARVVRESGATFD